MYGNTVVSYSGGCVINAIYDIGPSETYVEENEFGALYNSSENEWRLVVTPSTSYIVPETVAGNAIAAVNLDCISGIPTFEQPVTVRTTGDPIYLTGIKVTTSDLDFILNSNCIPTSLTGDFEYLDLSECGDSIEFPEEFLTNFQSKMDGFGEDWCTIYVSSAVKANYADYDFIQVKQ